MLTTLQAQLNDSSQQIEMLQLQNISEQTIILFQDVRETVNELHPASSCSDIPQYRSKPSGEYWIVTDSTSSPVKVFCDMDWNSCSCNTAGGWMRVSNLDMTDPNQNCPDGFRLVNRTTPPLRTCGRPGPAGCVSILPIQLMGWSTLEFVREWLATKIRLQMLLIHITTIDLLTMLTLMVWA